MAMNDVGEPHALDAFDGDAGKVRKALGVVRIVAAFVPVEMGTIKERRVVDKKIADAVYRVALDDGGKAQPIAQRNSDAGNQNRLGLVAAIARQQNDNLVAHLAQRPGQTIDDVREAAGL